MDVFI